MQQVPLIGVKNGVGTTAALPLQGCYLHVDPNDGFIRSGKATANGRSFAARLKLHIKATVGHQSHQVDRLTQLAIMLGGGSEIKFIVYCTNTTTASTETYYGETNES